MLISIPKTLRAKIGEEGAEDLVELLNTSSENTRDSILTFVEEKFERRLSEESAKIRGELTREISQVREEISHVRVEMHENQAATIRWMFLFWVGQIGALIGILFAFFR